jgi:hypothetical protein
MPINRENMKRIIAGFNLAFAFGLISLIVGCAQTQHTEDYLSAAGFSVVIATTPAQQQHLKTLPAYKMMRIQRNGNTRYVYADPARKQIFVGGLFAYDRYRDLRLAKNLAAEDLQDAKFNAQLATGWDVWSPF